MESSMTIRDIGKAIISAIARTEGEEIAIETSDLVIDSITDSEIVEKVPFVSWLVKAQKIGQSVRDQLFARKLARFLDSLEDIPQEQREAFLREIATDETKRTKFAETLITILDRFEDAEKADMLADAFKAYLSGHISYEEFHRFARAIDRCFVMDLSQLFKFDGPTDDYPIQAVDLAGAGLLEIAQLPSIRTSDSRAKFVLSDFGKLFLKVMNLR
jgi:hypothetical protein